MDNLARLWGLIELRGVAALLFGLAALLWLGLTLLVLIPLLTLYAVMNGIGAGITWFSHAKDSMGWRVFLLEGLIGIGAGIIALVRPGDATLALVVITALGFRIYRRYTSGTPMRPLPHHSTQKIRVTADK